MTKLITVGGVVLTAGIVIFPLSYVLGDVLPEVWGYTVARRVIWLGFACNALMVIAIWVGGEIPAAPFWKGQGAYEEILGQTPRILGASLAGYLAGEVANGIVQALGEVDISSPIVIRLDGTNAEMGREILKGHESDRLVSKATM